MEIEGLTLILNFEEIGKWGIAEDHFNLQNDKFMSTYENLIAKLEEKLENEAKKKNTYFGKVFDNLKISVKDIHVRFEQGLGEKETSSALGANLKSLRLFTVNDKDEDAFVKRECLNTEINKKVIIEELSVYTHDQLYDGQILSKKTVDEVLDVFEDADSMLYDEKTETIIDLSCNIALRQKNYDKTDTNNIPIWTVYLQVENLPFGLSTSVFKCITKFVDTYKIHSKGLDRFTDTAKYNYLKPKTKIRTLLEQDSEDMLVDADGEVKDLQSVVKSWWKFAITSTILNEKSRKIGVSLLKPKKAIIAEYNDDLKSQYPSFIKNGDADFDEHEYEDFHWLVQATPQEELVNLAKVLSQEWYKEEKAKRNKTTVAESEENTENEFEDNQLFDFTDLPDKYVKISFKIEIINSEFNLKNPNGLITLNTTGIKFTFNKKKKGQEVMLSIGNWNGQFLDLITGLNQTIQNNPDKKGVLEFYYNYENNEELIKVYHGKIGFVFLPQVIKLCIEIVILCEQNMKISYTIDDNAKQMMQSLMDTKNKLRINIMLIAPTIQIPVDNNKMLILDTGRLFFKNNENDYSKSGDYESYELKLSKINQSLSDYSSLENYMNHYDTNIGQSAMTKSLCQLSSITSPISNTFSPFKLVENQQPNFENFAESEVIDKEAQGETIQETILDTPTKIAPMEFHNIIKDFTIDIQFNQLTNPKLPKEDFILETTLNKLNLDLSQDTIASLMYFLSVAIFDMDVYSKTCENIQEESTNQMEVYYKVAESSYTKVLLMQCNDTIILLKPQTFVPQLRFEMKKGLKFQQLPSEGEFKVVLQIAEANDNTKSCQLASYNEIEVLEWINTMKLEKSKYEKTGRESIMNLDEDLAVIDRETNGDGLVIGNQQQFLAGNNGEPTDHPQTKITNEANAKECTFKISLILQGLFINIHSIDNFEGNLSGSISESSFEIYDSRDKGTISMAKVGKFIIKHDMENTELLISNNEKEFMRKDTVLYEVEKDHYFVEVKIYTSEVGDCVVDIEVNQAKLHYTPRYLDCIMKIVFLCLDGPDGANKENPAMIVPIAQPEVNNGDFIDYSTWKCFINIILIKTTLTCAINKDLNFIQQVSSGLTCNIEVTSKDIWIAKGMLEKATIYDMANYPSKDFGLKRIPDDQRLILVQNRSSGIEYHLDSKMEGFWIDLNFKEVEINWYTQIIMRMISYISDSILEIISPGLKYLIDNYKDKQLIDYIYDYWTYPTYVHFNITVENSEAWFKPLDPTQTYRLKAHIGSANITNQRGLKNDRIFNAKANQMLYVDEWKFDVRQFSAFIEYGNDLERQIIEDTDILVLWERPTKQSEAFIIYDLHLNLLKYTGDKDHFKQERMKIEQLAPYLNKDDKEMVKMINENFNKAEFLKDYENRKNIKETLYIDGDYRIILNCDVVKVNMYPDVMNKFYNIFATSIVFWDELMLDFEWQSAYDKDEPGNYHFFFNIQECVISFKQQGCLLDTDEQSLATKKLAKTNEFDIPKCHPGDQTNPGEEEMMTEKKPPNSSYNNIDEIRVEIARFKDQHKSKFADKNSTGDSKRNSKQYADAEIYDKKFAELILTEVSIKLIIDGVKTEKRTTVQSKDISGNFIDQNNVKMNFVKSFVPTSDLLNKTLSVDIKVGNNSNEFKIWFNETHLIFCWELLLKLHPFIELQDAYYPKGFEEFYECVESTNHTVIYYKNASVCFPDTLLKNSIISRGDITLSFFNFYSFSPDDCLFNIDFDQKDFELFTCSLVEYQEEKLNAVFKRHILYPTNFQYKKNWKGDNKCHSNIDFHELTFKGSLKDFGTLDLCIKYQQNTKTFIYDLTPYVPKVNIQKDSYNKLAGIPDLPGSVKQVDTLTTISETKDRTNSNSTITVKYEETIDISAAIIRIVVLNDQSDCFIPIFRSEFKIPCFTVMLGDNSVRTILSLSGHADFYHDKIGKWEPFIEEIMIDMQLIKGFEEVILALTVNNDCPQLNVNFSPEIYYVLKKTLKNFRKEKNKKQQKTKGRPTNIQSVAQNKGTIGKAPQKDYIVFDSRFLIRNVTGESIIATPVARNTRNFKEQMVDVEIPNGEEKFVNFRTMERSKNKIGDETEIKISMFNNRTQAKDWILITMDRVKEFRYSQAGVSVTVVVKNEDLKRVAIIASPLLICNKTNLPIYFNTSQRSNIEKQFLEKDKMIAVTCNSLNKMVNMTHNDKVSKSTPLEDYIKFNKGKGVNRKELFYSPDDKLHMLRLAVHKMDGLKTIIINPSFKIQNLLPIEIQLKISGKNFEKESLLNKNDTIEVYELDLNAKIQFHIRIMNNLETMIDLQEVIKKQYQKLKFVHPDKRYKKSRAKLFIKYSAKHCSFVIFTTFVILNETNLSLSMFSYNDLNDAKYLICDNDRRVFFMGKTQHENYGLEYNDKELKRIGVSSGRVKIGNSVYPKKIQHTIVSKITCSSPNNNEYFMHTLVIRPNIIKIYPELGIKSKIVQILPREVICNHTKRPIRVRQNQTTTKGNFLILEPGARGIMNWISKINSQQIVIEFDSKFEKLNESSPIDITKTSYKEFYVTNVNSDFKIYRYFKLIVTKMNEVLYIVQQEITEDQVTIKIENQTDITFSIMQEDSPKSIIKAHPKLHTPYAWRDPMGSKNIVILINSIINKQYNDFQTLFEVSKSNSIKLESISGTGPIKEIKIEIQLEDSVKKVIISEVGKTKRRNQNFNHSVIAQVFQFRLRIPETGLSICTFSSEKKKKRIELLYIQLSELFFAYVLQEKDSSISFTLREIFLNNNSSHSIDYPVIIRKILNKSPNDPTKNQDAIKFDLIWNNSTSKHQFNIKQQKFTMNKLQLFLEEEYIEELAKFFKDTFLPNLSDNLSNEKFNWEKLRNSINQITLKRHFINHLQLQELLKDITNYHIGDEKYHMTLQDKEKFVNEKGKTLIESKSRLLKPEWKLVELKNFDEFIFFEELVLPSIMARVSYYQNPGITVEKEFELLSLMGVAFGGFEDATITLKGLHILYFFVKLG